MFGRILKRLGSVFGLWRVGSRTNEYVESDENSWNEGRHQSTIFSTDCLCGRCSFHLENVGWTVNSETDIGMKRLSLTQQRVVCVIFATMAIVHGTVAVSTFNKPFLIIIQLVPSFIIGGTAMGLFAYTFIKPQ